MKCTNRSRNTRRNRKRELTIKLIRSAFILVCLIAVAVCAYVFRPRNLVTEYEVAAYSNSVYQADLFAEELCVTNKDVDFEEFHTNDEFPGALLFNIKDNEVLYAENIHERLYPASTTKLLTAYLALKYGDLSDVITVSEAAVSVPSDSSIAGLQAGDRLTLKDLLYGLMLPSGNDSAVVIAEYISGSSESFADLMNQEANSLGATNTHFVNPHGYHDDEHYTTAYDLYLIFNACVKNETFVDVISSTSWIADITDKNGAVRSVTWNQSNQFINGGREVPSKVTMIGGKTGTTYEAGYCLTMYGKDASDTPYISIIMGSTSKRNLYDNMTFLWAAIPN